jgi:hypothetical protein
MRCDNPLSQAAMSKDAKAGGSACQACFVVAEQLLKALFLSLRYCLRHFPAFRGVALPLRI